MLGLEESSSGGMHSSLSSCLHMQHSSGKNLQTASCTSTDGGLTQETKIHHQRSNEPEQLGCSQS